MSRPKIAAKSESKKGKSMQERVLPHRTRFGRHLKGLIEKRGVTLTAFATELGVSHTLLNHIFRGAAAVPPAMLDGTERTINGAMDRRKSRSTDPINLPKALGLAGEERRVFLIQAWAAAAPAGSAKIIAELFRKAEGKALWA